MQEPIRIGTRESQLAVWQANEVQRLLGTLGFQTVLVLIKSQGDLDLKTPLYELGVQGIFTRNLDQALINNKIDLAVHSLKDVPTLCAEGVEQAAVLKRGNPRDLLVFKGEAPLLSEEARKNAADQAPFTLATSSVRRKAQWLHRFPNHRIENLRGNVNSRLRRLMESDWNGAIFAAAGLERIQRVPPNSLTLEWMLPAPAQGAIGVFCRSGDEASFETCQKINDPETALCTGIERDFLRGLLGGCSTPIAALAEIEGDELYFSGNLLSPDGLKKAEIEKILPQDRAIHIGKTAAAELLGEGAKEIVEAYNHARK
jgi:hydroxymethylbilane synthase